MATDTDAARDGVLAARAELDEELRRLNASTRSAVDIPAKIRRSPAKAAAIAGGVAFLAVKGPQRVFRAGKRAVRGKDAPLPSKMLPEEIDKALRSLGSDGDKVRGALERDFAAYVKKAAADRRRLRQLVLLSVARPLATHGTRALANWLFSPEREGFDRRLSELRARADRSTFRSDGSNERNTFLFLLTGSLQLASARFGQYHFSPGDSILIPPHTDYDLSAAANSKILRADI